MKTQVIVSDLRLACVLAFAGYRFKTTSDPLGRQFIFENPEDFANPEGIEGLIREYENGVLPVSDARGLLEIFSEQLQSSQQMGLKHLNSGKEELLPTEHQDTEDRTYGTSDLSTAILLTVAGYRFRSASLRDGKTNFLFSWSKGLRDLISKYNSKALVVEPHLWNEAAYAMRDVVRDVNRARQRTVPISLGLSSVDE